MKGIFKGIQTIVSQFQTMINGIKMAIEFLFNLVKSLFELIKLLITTVGNATALIATLPPWLIAFATATIGVAVLYMILGRQTGKSD
ncbi:MAG: hypothetical protein II393_02135 [Cytophagales bacterium]|nr:hypothetical protein [Cytophagales bacterium]